MDIEIKDRKLFSVNITSIEMDWVPEGEHRIGGMCHIALTDQTGGENGPGANVFFGMMVDPSMPLRDVARATLARAHDVLARMASFSVDELEACFVEWRAQAIEQQKKADALGYPKAERG